MFLNSFPEHLICSQGVRESDFVRFLYKNKKTNAKRVSVYFPVLPGCSGMKMIPKLSSRNSALFSVYSVGQTLGGT